MHISRRVLAVAGAATVLVGVGTAAGAAIAAGPVTSGVVSACYKTTAASSPSAELMKTRTRWSGVRITSVSAITPRLVARRCRIASTRPALRRSQGAEPGLAYLPPPPASRSPGWRMSTSCRLGCPG